MRVTHYHDKIFPPMIASKTSTFIYSDANNDLFVSFLDIYFTQAEHIIELLDQFVKYIIKKINKGISKLLHQ